MAKQSKKHESLKICIFPGLVAKNKFDVLSRLSNKEATVIKADWNLGKPGQQVNESAAVLIIRGIASTRVPLKNVTISLVDDSKNIVDSIVTMDICV